MRPISEYQQLIGEAIPKIGFPKEPSELYEPLNYFLSLGGKRMRPVFVLLSHEMFGKKAEQAIPQALAYELFHNFTLIHDDIMDNAPLRRGLPTVHEKWNNNTAILAGDVLFVRSLQLLSQCDEKYFKPVHELFCQTAAEVCEGQQMDMDFEKIKNVSIGDYLKMITLKTAVLLGACLKTGAILAGAKNEDALHMYEFGKNIGIAFQLKDDLLDVYGDADKFGKQKGGDILSGKKTFLFLTAMNEADNATRKQLEKIFYSFDEHKVNTVTLLYDKAGIAEKTEKEMNRYFQLALSHLEKISLPAGNKKPLEKLAEQLMSRVS